MALRYRSGVHNSDLKRAKPFFWHIQGPKSILLNPFRGCFFKQTGWMDETLGFAGQIKSFRGPYVVHAWYRSRNELTSITPGTPVGNHWCISFKGYVANATEMSVLRMLNEGVLEVWHPTKKYAFPARVTVLISMHLFIWQVEWGCQAFLRFRRSKIIQSEMGDKILQRIWGLMHSGFISI